MELDDILLTACFRVFRQKKHWNEMMEKTKNGLKNPIKNSRPEG